jgi:regulator of protease activity HflC (stomatin/prohibitin superfamily)
MIIGGLVLLGVILLLTMFYTVEADEVAIVQRFGKYVRREEPGLRTKLPFGLETVRKAKVQRVFKAEFGFRVDGQTGAPALAQFGHRAHRCADQEHQLCP